MKILLHACCGPCATYPASELLKADHQITGYFYNPNIHPIEEFRRRKEAVELYSKISGVDFIYSNDFNQAKWENFKGNENERCRMCYVMRMNETARVAKEKGFDAFTTTLLVSPYQRHDELIELGEKFASLNGIKFFYSDFRTGFRTGQNMAREMGLYRQKFCGCIISYNESPYRKKGKI